MTTANLGDQLRTNLTDAVGKAREVSEDIRDRVGTGYRTIQRGIRDAKTTAEDAINDARREIKARPLTITATAAISGFALGLLTGWIIASRRR
jgi:ElaB/YqjD/DUF883 family membrane-anchored ribosome-binding protein